VTPSNKLLPKYCTFLQQFHLLVTYIPAFHNVGADIWWIILHRPHGFISQFNLSRKVLRCVGASGPPRDTSPSCRGLSTAKILFGRLNAPDAEPGVRRPARTFCQNPFRPSGSGDVWIRCPIISILGRRGFFHSSNYPLFPFLPLGPSDDEVLECEPAFQVVTLFL